MFRSRTLPSLSPAGVVAVAFLLGQVSPVWAQRFPLIRNSPEVVAAFRNVVTKPSQSTVRVLCDDQPAVLGTIVSADGYILTKASELSGQLACKLPDGRTMSAKVVGVEETYDLAMLKVPASRLHPVEWRAGKSAEVGDWLAAPGTGKE